MSIETKETYDVVESEYKAPMVYKAINNVSEELLSGIKKNSKNEMQKFMFRGIDAVYNALAPALVKHGLVIIPRIINRNVTERETRNGGALFYVTIKAEFDFISVKDGSKVTVENFGEAMDSGDKATNKAMSIAYKYAAFQLFCIPTEDTSVDPDSQAHEVQSKTLSDERFNTALKYISNAKTEREATKYLTAVGTQGGSKEQYNLAKSVYEKRLIDIAKGDFDVN